MCALVLAGQGLPGAGQGLHRPHVRGVEPQEAWLRAYGRACVVDPGLACGGRTHSGGRAITGIAVRGTQRQWQQRSGSGPKPSPCGCTPTC